MSRRRPTLAAYLRRRWRALGGIVVLVLGAILVLGVTDRGHDPIWEAHAGELQQAGVSPDATQVYALLREDGRIASLQARQGTDGGLVWESRLNASRALLAVGADGAAIATDFPLAFLTVYGADGDIVAQEPLEGNPVAMVIDGKRLALALNAPRHPILLYENGVHIRTHHAPSPVQALDMEAGFVATGGLAGDVVVFAPDHNVAFNLSLDMSIRTLRLAADGTSLIVGGSGLTPADRRGHVAYLDVGANEPLRWSRETSSGVGLVDTDSAGLFALAVEEAPPSATIRVYEGSTGATLWTRLVRGSVARDDAGTHGGAAISPDARAVALATLRGDITIYDTQTGDERWTYRAGGANLLAFGDDAAHRLLVGGRLLPNRPIDSLLLFSAGREPLIQQAGPMTGAILVAGAGLLALYVGVGYWRVRRAY